jgi:hypothetical protein
MISQVRTRGQEIKAKCSTSPYNQVTARWWYKGGFLPTSFEINRGKKLYHSSPGSAFGRLTGQQKAIPATNAIYHIHRLEI